MPFETILNLSLFAIAMLYTPGPNNVMLATSAVRFGFRATLPHIFGVSLGFSAMLFAVALGLGELFEHSTFLREGLRWVGAGVMLWIGWKIAMSGRAGDQDIARPWSVWQGAGFQWINPKGWSICIAIAASFVTGAAPVTEAAICTLVFAVVGTSSAMVWAAFGKMIRRFLSTQRRARAFNIAMGLLIAGCAGTLLID